MKIPFILGTAVLTVNLFANTLDWKIFDSETQQSVNWNEFIATLNEAEIVVVGEYHNNALGHELEAKITQELIKLDPKTTIALEMFERDEQAIVDLYLDGKIQQKTLETLTDSSSWGGQKNSWEIWYQPIVDLVKINHSQGANLVAANAPRHYVKMARLEGFEVLKDIETQTNNVFVVPDLSVDDSDYKNRFLKLMSPAGASPMMMSKMNPEAIFRSQQVWDATMADSVVKAKSHANKVILFIGDYHIAFDGGTLLRIKAALPEAKIVSVSIPMSDTVDEFNMEDKSRANFVIYTKKD